MNKDCFGKYHPIVNFIYFAVILFFAMINLNPICLLISTTSAFLYALYLVQTEVILKKLKYMLPLMLVAMVINPIFNHEGSTILAYFKSGNPLTLESIYYSIASSVMIFCVILWYVSFEKVITSDKFIYLFSKIIPSLSLILSMILRFIPKFKHQYSEVSQRYADQKRYRQKNTATILSIMITWSLENAIETADSMKSRGYGLPNRTAFTHYIFNESDRDMLIFIIINTSIVAIGFLIDVFFIEYFPITKMQDINRINIVFYLWYIALHIIPIIINIREDSKWKI